MGAIGNSKMSSRVLKFSRSQVYRRFLKNHDVNELISGFHWNNAQIFFDRGLGSRVHTPSLFGLQINIIPIYYAALRAFPVENSEARSAFIATKCG